MSTIRQQIRNNAVALISLVVAVSALAYNTWRNEKTEEQRNVRHASFQVLQNLGELQQVVDFRFYYLPFNPRPDEEGALRIGGYGHVAMIHDLMMLMPAPAPAAGEALRAEWQQRFEHLDDLGATGGHTEAARAAERGLTAAIERSRVAVLDVLRGLE